MLNRKNYIVLNFLCYNFFVIKLYSLLAIEFFKPTVIL